MASLDRGTGITRRRPRQGARAAAPTQAPAPTHAVATSANASAVDLLQRVRVALSTVQIYGVTLSSSHEGVVVIDGAVRTDEAYQSTERLAALTPGVRQVVNHLVHDPLVGSVPVQRTVTSPELAAEIELNHFHFVTPTEDRFNQVIGTTDTAIATDEAEPYFAPTDPPTRRAPREEGGYIVVGGFSPTALDSPITLEQLPRPLRRGDDEIAREVRLALNEDAGTADLPVHVSARNGIVRLRGIVPSLDDTDLAEEVAARVPGVLEVQEELEVVGLESSPSNVKPR